MRKFALCSCFAAVCCFSALAQTAGQISKDFLKGKHIKFTHPNPSSFKVHGNIPSPNGFPAGVDTVVNFTGQFEAQGIYPTSNTTGVSRNIWQYSIVGNSPDQGGTTTIHAPVIPVTIDMLDADGSQAFVKTTTQNCPTCTRAQLGKKVELISSLDSQTVSLFMNSPVFQNSAYTSSPVATQISDAEQRAEFGNQARADWHTLLAGNLLPGQTMFLKQSASPNPPAYYFALNNDGSCCAFVLASDPVFSGQLFPPAAPDNSTVIGAAEVNHKIHTADISTFLFPNVYLFENNDPNQCCVLGYHSLDVENGDSSNGNRTRFYVVNYSSWMSPGLFIVNPNLNPAPAPCSEDADNCLQDVTAHSHEMAETFNDPFVGFDGIHNVTPFWLNPAGQCQDLLEVGDAIEDLDNPSFPVTINGFTYHPTTIALLPWFEFQGNSTAINNAYSYPNETVLTSLSAPQPLNCGGQ